MDVWSDPKWEYIQSPESLSLERLAEKWHKQKGDGYCVQSLMKRSADEGWVSLRSRFREKLEGEVEKKLVRYLSKGRFARLKNYIGVLSNVLKTAYEEGFDLKKKQENIKAGKSVLEFKSLGEIARIVIQTADSLGNLEKILQGQGTQDGDLTIIVGEEISDDYSKSVSELQADSASTSDAPEQGEVQGTDGGDSERKDI